MRTMRRTTCRRESFLRSLRHCDSSPPDRDSAGVCFDIRFAADEVAAGT
jgi:hypothetical protein